MKAKRFTVYDMLEANGHFARNPANPGAQADDGTALYAGPVEFPKMFYHPEGKRRVIVPAEVQVTPLGPKLTNEQTEIISVLVQTPADEARLRADGWHDHPAKAIGASGAEAPDMGAGEKVKSLAAQLAALRAELAAKGEADAAAARPMARRA